MNASTHLEHVRAAGERIPADAEGRFDTPVPSCPGYDVRRLVTHTGGFSRFVRASLEANAFPDMSGWVPPDEPLAYHREHHTALVEALAARDPGQQAWSWGHDQHVRFWYRRAAQELAVHAWDVANAVGRPYAIDPELAADGVDEFLDEFAGRPQGPQGTPGVAALYEGTGQRLHLHATDTAGEWVVTMHPDRVEVVREHAKGDVAARGPASDLLLFVWGRVAPSDLEVHGDASLLTRWQDRVKI